MNMNPAMAAQAQAQAQALAIQRMNAAAAMNRAHPPAEVEHITTEQIQVRLFSMGK
jgi:hypothetical protein